MPIGFRLEGLKEKIAELKKKAENAGRNPKSISVTVFGPKPDKKELAELSDLGIERVILMLPAAARDTVLPLLDQYAALKAL